MINLKSRSCVFCDSKESHIEENEICYLKYDKYPVSKGHMLVIPVRHVENFFDLRKNEINSIFSMIKRGQELIQKSYKPDGYNIGININKAAGQTVDHAHIHLIPRYTGDIDDPSGGVRGVIPSKRKYLKD